MKLKIKSQIILLLVFLQTIAIVLMTFFCINQTTKNIKTNFEYKLKNDLHQIQGVISMLLKHKNLPGIQNIISSLITDVTNSEAYLIDDKGYILFSTDMPAIGKSIFSQNIDIDYTKNYNYIKNSEKNIYIGQSMICENIPFIYSAQKCVFFILKSDVSYLIQTQVEIFKMYLYIFVFTLILINLTVFIFTHYKITVKIKFLIDYFNQSNSKKYQEVLKDNDEITELAKTYHKAIELLRESEKESKDKANAFYCLVEYMQDGFIAIDKEGIIKIFNAAAEEIFGYSKNEIIGKNINLLMSKEDSTLHDNAVKKHLTTNKKTILNFSREVKGIKKDGSDVIISISVSEMLFDGNFNEKFIATIRDLSDEKKLENFVMSTEKMKAISLLSSQLAHDFNNLLTIVSCNLEMIREKYKDEFIANKSKISLNAINRGLFLIDGLMSLSRERNNHKQTIDINYFLTDFCNFLKPFLGERIDIVFTPFDEEIKFYGNISELETCLINLATNSKDAMNKIGKLTILTKKHTLSAKQQHIKGIEKNSNYFLIEITDTGKGIPEESLNKIFLPFFSMKNKNYNSGLGLSTVLSFIKNCNGFIEVNSSLNKGTTFKIFLPISEKEIKDEDTNFNTKNLTGNKEKIILVEKEPNLIEHTLFILTFFNYEVEILEPNSRLLSKIKEKEFNIIILNEKFLLEHEEIFLYMKKINDKVLNITSSEISKISEFPNLRKPYSRYELGLKIKEIFKLQN